MFVEGSVVSGCQIDLYCDCTSLPLIFDITKPYKQFNFLWCSDPINIGDCVCSLNGYDKRETLVENQNGPAVSLQDITVSAVVSTTLSSSVTPEPSKCRIMLYLRITNMFIIVTNIPDNPLSGGAIAGIVMVTIFLFIVIVIVIPVVIGKLN